MGDLKELLSSINEHTAYDSSTSTSRNALRLNSIFKNSLDMRLPAVDDRQSFDGWNELLNMNGDFKQASASRNNVDASLPISRLLAQTYSYSSDSSGSPHATSSRFSPPSQATNRGGNGVFSYGEESPQSTGSNSSRQSFSYSSAGSGCYPNSYRMNSLSEQGSPTLDEAILMGCLPDSPFSNNSTSVHKNESPTLLDLMSSLSVNGNGYTSSPNSHGNTNAYLGRSAQNQGLSQNSGPNIFNSPSVQLNNGVGNGMNGNSSTLSQLSSGLNGLNMTQIQNMLMTSQLYPNLLDSSVLGSLNDLRVGSINPSLSGFLPSNDPYAIEKAAKMHRNAAALCDATCTWSGILPSRSAKNPFYSCKVFLGGVPWDVTELTLRQAFIQFGTIQVEWPGKENSANPPRGYVYILFENEKQVKEMLTTCTQDAFSGNYYYKISSRRMRQKEVQVIPWIVSDSNYVRCPSYQLDPAKTVFVGALHGMLSAEGLAHIMNDLFGGVVYSGIDTDKHKYPIGSGRVTFNNVQAYKKAVKAAFIEIKTAKFVKKVQVDPYLADSLCQLCNQQQGPYFCRDETCFKYFCRSCWQATHNGDVSNHKPLMRDPKLRTQTSLNRVL